MSKQQRRLCKSTSQSVIQSNLLETIPKNGLLKTVRRSTSLRNPKKRDTKTLDTLLTKMKLKQRKSSREDVTLETVREGVEQDRVEIIIGMKEDRHTSELPRERVEIGKGVKAFLDQRREQLHISPVFEFKETSPIKRLKRSLSARLLESDLSNKEPKRFNSLAIRRVGTAKAGKKREISVANGKGMDRVRLDRPKQLPIDNGRCAVSEDEGAVEPSLRKTISSDQILRERFDSPDIVTEHGSVPSSVSSFSSTEKRNREVFIASRALCKKKKYFSDRAGNKNIFKKLIHPNYQERAQQYRRLFGKAVDETDQFLTSYSCAYQRDILCQGRIYISQQNVCFYANIFGWETNLVLPTSQIVAITKEKAALIFPNSIQIEMKGGVKHFFASFVNREKSLTVLHMVHEQVQQGEVITPEELWEIMNPDEDDKVSSKRLSRPKIGQSAMVDPSSSGSPQKSRPDSEFPSIAEASSNSSLDQEDIICPCESHSGKLLLDNVYPLTTDEIYDLLFTDSPWFKRFNHVLKNTGYVASDWATDKDGFQTRTCTYTMALNHAMAPKSCVVTEKQVISHFGRPGDGFIVNKDTQNSGVPYANDFSVQCSYCITKIGEKLSRMKIHGGIVYKKSIWSVVKSYIEKSIYQGLDDHYKALESTLQNECEMNREVAVHGQETLSNVDFDETNRLVSTNENVSTEITASIFRDRQLRKDEVFIRDKAPDYGLYIKIIICLLSGLLILNVMFLFRINNLDTESSLKEEITKLAKRFSLVHQSSTPHTDPKEAALETILSTVSQLANDLQKMKKQISYKEDL